MYNLLVRFLVLTLFLFSVIVSEINIQKTVDNYGEYTTAWSDFAFCRGPKSKNLSDLAGDIVKFADGSYVFYLNMTVKQANILHEVKTEVFKIDGKKKKNLFNYKVTDPCKSMFMFAEVARRELGSANCRFKKGFYPMKYNFTQLSTVFLGKYFYYGNYFVRSTAISKQGNICCFHLKFLIKKNTK